MQAALDHSHRHGDRFGLLYIDLDKFKPINDTLGHAAGDRVLREVAARLRASLRGEDVAARLGGDEFVILVRNLEAPEDVVEVAERLLTSLKPPVLLDHRKLPVEASIGISICPENGTTAEALKEKADTAMYKAKANGMGYCFADEAITGRAAERVRYGDDLRAALEQSQFFLHYQPWVDITSRHWLGLEALARWPHPRDGDISPAVFIPLAERCGLVQQFGQWALRTACRQGKAWLDAGLEFGYLSVNISAAHFAQDDFVEQLQSVLNETEFPAQQLELEVTEACIMDTSAALLERLTDIHQLGVNLCLDDFGAGYTFLAYLKDAPIDRVKIARSLITNIPGGRKDTALIRAMASMASGLDFTLVGKGVETEGQCDALLKAGCPQAQGYLFAEPMTAAQVENTLAQNIPA